jgi:excisionase family DNA binding protein
MNASLIRGIIDLTNANWRPYNYEVPKAIYDRLECPHAYSKGQKKPFWFCRGDIFLCVSCSKGCTLTRPEGMLLTLPLRFSSSKPKKEFLLPPAELARSKYLLRPDEAAYCLNISVRTVYTWIDEGKLRKLKAHPTRIAAEDVARLMTEFENQ